jgi:hypothetical protein
MLIEPLDYVIQEPRPTALPYRLDRVSYALVENYHPQAEYQTRERAAQFVRSRGRCHSRGHIR